MSTPPLGTQATASEYRAQYESDLEHWRSMVDELAALIRQQLDDSHIDALVKGRAKNPSSYETKVRRIIRDQGSFDYYRSIEDVAAFRIITQDQTDKRAAVSAFKTMIEKLGGRIVEAPTADRVHTLSPWEFAYRSHHLNFSLDAQNASTSWAVCSGHMMELQVRTIAEHAWAAPDHHYRYKTALPLTQDAVRRLFMISAQLESIDIQLEEIRQAHETRLGEDGRRLVDGGLDVPITESNVKIYLRTNAELDARIGTLKDRGWPIPEAINVHVEGGVLHTKAAIHPETMDESIANTLEADAARQLASACAEMGLTTVEQLHNAALSALTDKTTTALRAQAEHHFLDLQLLPADIVGLALCSQSDTLPSNFYQAWARAIAAIRLAEGGRP